MSPVAHPNELSLQHKRKSSFTPKDEPSTVRQNRGLLPSNAHPDELSLQTQAVELLHHTKKSPAAHSMSPVAHPDELSLQHKRTSSFTSKDEPSTVRQNRGLLPSNAHPDELSLQTQAVELPQLTKKSPAAHSMSPVAHPDELSLQHKRTSSFTSKDEPSTVRQNRGLLPSNAHPDELSLQTQAVELLHHTKKSPAAHSMSPVAHPDELSLQHKRTSSFTSKDEPSTVR